MTLEEARDLVQRSGTLLVPGWDLEQSFMLDQIKRQDISASFEETNVWGARMVSINVDRRIMVVWSMAPKTNKPKFMDVQNTAQGKMIV